jgi:hypothetical protein
VTARQDVLAWNERIAATAPRDRAGEPALRKWLSGQGVTGYAQALLVWETFGSGRLAEEAAPVAEPRRARVVVYGRAGSGW